MTSYFGCSGPDWTTRGDVIWPAADSLTGGLAVGADPDGCHLVASDATTIFSAGRATAGPSNRIRLSDLVTVVAAPSNTVELSDICEAADVLLVFRQEDRARPSRG